MSKKYRILRPNDGFQRCRENERNLSLSEAIKILRLKGMAREVKDGLREEGKYECPRDWTKHPMGEPVIVEEINMRCSTYAKTQEQFDNSVNLAIKIALQELDEMSDGEITATPCPYKYAGEGDYIFKDNYGNELQVPLYWMLREILMRVREGV